MKKLILLVALMFTSATFAGGAAGFSVEILSVLKKIMVGKKSGNLTTRQSSSANKAIEASSRLEGDEVIVNLSKGLNIDELLKVEVNARGWSQISVELSHMGPSVITQFSLKSIDSLVKKIVKSHKLRPVSIINNKRLDPKTLYSTTNKDFTYNLDISNGGSTVKLSTSYQNEMIVGKIIENIGFNLEKFAASAAALL